MNETFEKIKIWFNKLIKKDELLVESKNDSSDTLGESIKTNVNSNITNNINNNSSQKQDDLFVENTYEIDKLKAKLESGAELIENISYEKKLELIKSYETENELLVLQIDEVLRKNSN